MSGVLRHVYTSQNAGLLLCSSKLSMPTNYFQVIIHHILVPNWIFIYWNYQKIILFKEWTIKIVWCYLKKAKNLNDNDKKYYKYDYKWIIKSIILFWITIIITVKIITQYTSYATANLIIVWCQNALSI